MRKVANQNRYFKINTIRSKRIKTSENTASCSSNGSHETSWLKREKRIKINMINSSSNERKYYCRIIVFMAHQERYSVHWDGSGTQRIEPAHFSQLVFFKETTLEKNTKLQLWI
jgi:hypothetical protein